MRFLLSVVLLFLVQTAQAYPVVPDDELTPGDYCSESDSDFLYLRYEEQVPFCKRRVNRQLKQRVYEAYDIPSRCRSQYTVDHFIPLSMGGSNSIKNLWPEHYRVKELRMDLETDVHFKLEVGILTRDEAVALVIQDKVMARAVTQFPQGGTDCDQPDEVTP